MHTRKSCSHAIYSLGFFVFVFIYLFLLKKGLQKQRFDFGWSSFLSPRKGIFTLKLPKSGRIQSHRLFCSLLIYSKVEYSKHLTISRTVEGLQLQTVAKLSGKYIFSHFSIYHQLHSIFPFHIFLIIAFHF